MLCARIRHVGFRACRTRASAGGGRDAVGTGGHHGYHSSNTEIYYRHALYLLWKRLSPYALVLLLLFLPRHAYAAPSLEVDGNFAGYEDGEEYKGYVVVDSPDNYQSTLCLIGEWSKLPQITTEQYEKLSNPSTGGAFYELSQQWRKIGHNASFTEEYYPQWLALSEEFANGLVTVYGYGKVWAVVATDSLLDKAHEDFITILEGQDIGSGGNVGLTDEIELTLEPMCGGYQGRNPYLREGYPVNGSKIYTIIGAGSTKPDNYTFKIKMNKEIDFDGKQILAWISPSTSNYVYLNVYVCSSLSLQDKSFVQTTEKDPPEQDIVMTYPWYVYTLTPTNYFSISISNMASSNVYNANVQTVTSQQTRTLGGYESGNPQGFFVTNSLNNAPVEPSPDPWEPPTTPDTPTNPTTPTPKDPITPNPPTLPGTPTDPTQPAPPQSPTVDDGGTFTVDLQGILDALDEHCIHIQTCLNSNFSGQNSYLGELFSTYTAAIVDQIYNGDVSKIGAIGDVNNTIAQGFSDIFEYWDDYTEWLDKKLDFKIPESDPYDDKDLLSWLRKIWARQGTGDVNTRPVDPATNYGGMTKWLGVLYGEITGDVSDTSITALSTSLNALQHTFPFSLPWDIQQILQALDATPATPEASITIPAMQGATRSYSYDIDLHWMDSAMVPIRAFELLAFVLYCLVHTKDVFGYVVGDA